MYRADPFDLLVNRLHHYYFSVVDGVATTASVPVAVTDVVFTSLAFIEQQDELLVFFTLVAVAEHSVAFAAVAVQWSSVAETFLTEAVELEQHDDDFAFLAVAFSSQRIPAVATPNEATVTSAAIAIIRIFMVFSKNDGQNLIKGSNDAKNRP